MPAISTSTLSNETSALVFSVPIVSDVTLEQYETLSSRSSSTDSIDDSIQVVAGSQPRATTPPIVNILMDMGFSRAHVNIALNL